VGREQKDGPSCPENSASELSQSSRRRLWLTSMLFR
jgi:hypothetical protein